MNERQREELRTLAEKLPLVPEGKFNLSIWGSGTLDTKRPEFSCNYVACAVGWAPKLIPGCSLKLEQFGSKLHPVYNGVTGFEAVAEYFGLEMREVLFLFDSSEYESWEVTPQEVSARILDFLDDPSIVPEEGPEEDDEEWEESDCEDDSTEDVSVEEAR